MITMSVYIDKRTNIIYINFIFKGIRFRESLHLKATKTNLKLAERIDKEIQGLILAGKFNVDEFKKYFPNSKTRKIELIGGVSLKDENITFKEYAERWIERKKKEYEAGLVKRSTYFSYLKGIRKAEKLNMFYELPLNEIKISHIKNFIAEISQNLKPKTIINILTPIRLIFNEAFDDGILKDNIMSRIRNPKLTKPEIEPFTKEEVLKILNYFKNEYPHMFALVAVMVYTGMRVNEVLAMKWKYFDFNTWTYTVKENFSHRRLSTPKTINSIREIKIPEDLQNIIEQHKKYTFMKSEFVFLNYYNKPFTDSTWFIQNYWKPALKELGIKYRSLRQLRHTHAILSLIAGDNPHDVAKRLGHSSLQMLYNRYAKFIKSEVAETKINEYLKQNGQHIVSMKKLKF